MTGGLYSQIALTKRGSEAKKDGSPYKFIDYMNDDDEIVHIESNFGIKNRESSQGKSQGYDSYQKKKPA